VWGENWTANTMTDRFANDTEQGNGKDNNAAKRFNALPYPAIRHDTDRINSGNTSNGNKGTSTTTYLTYATRVLRFLRARNRLNS
jgi:hypothetical protein